MIIFHDNGSPDTPASGKVMLSYDPSTKKMRWVRNSGATALGKGMVKGVATIVGTTSYITAVASTYTGLEWSVGHESGDSSFFTSYPSSGEFQVETGDYLVSFLGGVKRCAVGFGDIYIRNLTDGVDLSQLYRSPNRYDDFNASYTTWWVGEVSLDSSKTYELGIYTTESTQDFRIQGGHIVQL